MNNRFSFGNETQVLGIGGKAEYLNDLNKIDFK